MSKHTPPFRAFHSSQGATINGEPVSDWVMYNSVEADPLFSEMLEALLKAEARLVSLERKLPEHITNGSTLVAIQNAIAKAKGEIA